MPSALGGQAAISFLPAGSMVDFAGSTAPSGWLMTDGAAVSRTVYADLFASIGTAYGVGDGSTTFNLPDFRGRFARYNDDMGTARDAAFVNATTVTAGSFVVGRRYKIVTVGTTSFTSIGAASNTVGVIFTATGVGSGTGTALLTPLKNQAQNDAVQGHTHKLPGGKNGSPSFSGAPSYPVWAVSMDSYNTDAYTIGASGGNYGSGPAMGNDGSNGTPRTGEETRPINLSCNRIIKY